MRRYFCKHERYIHLFALPALKSSGVRHSCITSCISSWRGQVRYINIIQGIRCRPPRIMGNYLVSMETYGLAFTCINQTGKHRPFGPRHPARHRPPPSPPTESAEIQLSSCVLPDLPLKKGRVVRIGRPKVRWRALTSKCE